MLITSIIQETLSLPTYDDFLVVDKQWEISRSIERVIGIAVFPSFNSARMYGKINIVLPETVTYNELVQSKIKGNTKGLLFFPVNWKNNGSPVRLFYRNLTASAFFAPYDITVLLKVQYAH